MRGLAIFAAHRRSRDGRRIGRERAERQALTLRDSDRGSGYASFRSPPSRSVGHVWFAPAYCSVLARSGLTDDREKPQLGVRQREPAQIAPTTDDKLTFVQDCLRRPGPERSFDLAGPPATRSLGERQAGLRGLEQAGSQYAPQHTPGAHADDGYLLAVKPTAEPQHGLTSHSSLPERRPDVTLATRLIPPVAL
jgi:hypothetical protein